MATWSVDILPLGGGSPVASATTFRNARITWALDSPGGAAEFNLRASDAESGLWLPGRKRVRVRDGSGTARYQGFLDRLDRSGGPETTNAAKPLPESWRASSKGLSSILDKRVVHGNFNVNGTAAHTAAWSLVNHAKSQDTGVGGMPQLLGDWTLGTVTGSAASVDRFYCDGDIIGERLRELAESYFDWEIDAQARMNIWVGARGTDRTSTRSIAPTDCSDWSCVWDMDEFATYVTGLGESQGSASEVCGDPLVVDYDPLRMEFGRREAVIDTDMTTEPELQTKTRAELTARIGSGIELKTGWLEGRGPWSFGTVWLGDTVVGKLGTGFGGDRDVQLTSVSVSLEGMHEFVECEWRMVP